MWTIDISFSRCSATKVRYLTPTASFLKELGKGAQESEELKVQVEI